jgi:hypothetical protein
MRKTGKQVQSDVIALLNSGELPALVSGKVYRNGYRPRDSRLEDIIVTFTTGLPEQIQTGIVTVNIYVADVKGRNGVMLEDGRRCEELEIAAVEWVDSLTASASDYRFTLQQTVYTENDADIDQQFVVIKLKYEILDI